MVENDFWDEFMPCRIVVFDEATDVSAGMNGELFEAAWHLPNKSVL